MNEPNGMHSESLAARVRRVQSFALLVGGVAFLATVAGAFFERKQFFFSYLFAWLFWLGLSLGCFVVTMIHQLTGGRWGYPTRRLLEAGFSLLPLMLILFIPVLFGLHELYPWAQPAQVATEKVLRERSAYQNSWAFIIRGLVVFLIWIAMARRLRHLSLEQDLTSDALPTRKARTLSGPGIVAFALLATLAYVDWILSLETRWYSTMFPVIVIGGQIVVTYAFSVLLVTWLKDLEPLASVVTRTHYHHLGNLLLTFVLFWTYVAFGQLLIIYSGDLPPEISWYLHRKAGSWKIVIALLALFHFFFPFLLLLFRPMKFHARALATLAAILCVAHAVDTYWLVMPAFHHDGLALSWLDFAAFAGIGGLWLFCFFWRLKSAPLLPQQDPGMQFAFVYGH